MQRVRKEDISLHHYIKNTVLSDFVETDDRVELVYLKDESSSGSYVYGAKSQLLPLPTGVGRGWRYLDNIGDVTEQEASVIVYDAVGSVIDANSYRIDYIDGRVIFPTTTVVPETITYKWNYVAVVDEWVLIENSEVPIVVVDISGFTKKGFQLGGGKLVPRNVNLHVFASDTAERDDIMETLYDGLYLNSCPNQYFPSGTMLDWDGTFNDSYEYVTISGSSSLKFQNIEARAVAVPLLSIPNRDLTMLSDVNRYRGRVKFEMFHWSEA